MRNRCRGLQQQQALDRIDQAHAAPQLIAHHGGLVFLWRIAEHGELEAPLAVLAGVAGGGVAARLVHDRPDMIRELDPGLGQHALHFHRNRFLASRRHADRWHADHLRREALPVDCNRWWSCNMVVGAAAFMRMVMIALPLPLASSLPLASMLTTLASDDEYSTSLRQDRPRDRPPDHRGGGRSRAPAVTSNCVCEKLPSSTTLSGETWKAFGRLADAGGSRPKATATEAWSKPMRSTHPRNHAVGAQNMAQSPSRRVGETGKHQRQVYKADDPTANAARGARMWRQGFVSVSVLYTTHSPNVFSAAAKLQNCENWPSASYLALRTTTLWGNKSEKVRSCRRNHDFHSVTSRRSDFPERSNSPLPGLT